MSVTIRNIHVTLLAEWRRYLVVGLVLFVAGCAAVPQETEEQRTLREIAASQDPQMVGTWFPSPFGDYRVTLVERDWVTLRRQRPLARLLVDASAVVGDYARRDSSNDEVAQRYREIAQARGNGVHLHKATLNSAIVNLINPLVPGGDVWIRKAKRDDLDAALLEFTKDGRITSALVRIVTIAEKRGNLLDPFPKAYAFEDVHIVTGPYARRIEHRIGNRQLEDTYLTTFDKP